MKITKRQLRRIIKEEKAKLKEYGGRPYDPTVPSEQSKQLSAGMKTTVDDYVAWAEENGHITPAASSVVASYIVEDPKREGSKVVIADAFGMRVSEITREVERQQAERAAMMGESRMKITKRQLRRIIRESIKEGHGGYREYGEDEMVTDSRAGSMGEAQPMRVDPKEIQQMVADIAHEPVFRNAKAEDIAAAAMDQLGDLSAKAYDIAWGIAKDMGFPA